MLDTVKQLDIRQHDKHVVVLPLTHAAWFTAAAHLHVGATTYIQRSWDPEALLKLIECEKITKLHMIPTLLGDLLAVAEERECDVASVELISLAGSLIPQDMMRRATALFGPIIGNIYGLTEAAGPVTYMMPADFRDSRAGSVGHPGRNTQIRIVVDETVQSHAQQLGEIQLRGSQITPGYLGRPMETEAAFDGDWFCTGDIGFLDDDGFLFVVDRKKDMIKTGGLNVYPKEVEDVLYSHPKVLEASVFGTPDARWIEKVCAAVTLRSPDCTAEELIEFCRERLPAYKAPKAVMLVDALPRTAFGKFDRRALAKAYP